MARTGDGSPANPFIKPPEMESFWLTRPEQNFENERARSHGREQRVWEKTTAASRYNSITRLRDEELPMAPMPLALKNELAAAKGRLMEEEIPDETFLTTIATKPAVGLAEPLRQKETEIRTYIHKKREIFLAHMARDVKKAEIVKLEEKAKMREEALGRSQQMLDEDRKKFEDFLQDRLERATSTNKEAEAHAKKKLEKQQKLRQLKSQIESVQSEIGRFREVREECTRYKEFLTQLTPPEWKEQQRSLKLARKAQRREAWISKQLAPILSAIADEEERIDRAAAREEREATEAAKSQRRGKSRRNKEEDEEQAQREKERQARRKRLQRRREEEQRRVANAYEDMSSEEEPELFFKEPQELMDTLTELEEKNLFLIQGSQDTEQQLDELQHNFGRNKAELSAKVQQLKQNIRQLEQNIAYEKQRGAELRRTYSEKASTQLQDKKLVDLTQKVAEVYVRCGLSVDGSPDPLQMLALIESKMEELISGLDQAFHEDSALVMSLEWSKEKERRERLKEFRRREQSEKQEERLKNSWLRSQARIYKKTGKQVMFRSPPTRVQQREVVDTSEDEAHAYEHQIFGVYIDRKTQRPQTEPPVIQEESRRAVSAPRLGSSSRPTSSPGASLRAVSASDGDGVT